MALVLTERLLQHDQVELPGNDGAIVNGGPGAALTTVQFAVEKVLHELLVGSRSSAATRQAVLPQIQQLAKFLDKT